MTVEAIFYDAEGRIIGGGRTPPRMIAPQASARIIVPMTTSEDPSRIARVEVTAAYPVIDLAPYAP